MQNKIVLTLNLIAILNTPLHADLGTNFTVYAHFYMKDGSDFEACFDVHSFALENRQIYLSDDKKRLTDTQCLFAFKSSDTRVAALGMSAKSSDKGAITVLRALEEFKINTVRKNQDFRFEDVIGLVFPEDIVHVKASAVKRVKYKRHKISAHTGGIYYTTTGMMDTIRDMRCWTIGYYKIERFFPVFSGQDDLGLYYNFFNYNNKYNESEIDRLITLKYNPASNPKIRRILSKYPQKTVEELPYDAQVQFYLLWEQQKQEAERWFWKNGVLITSYYIGC